MIDKNEINKDSNKDGGEIRKPRLSKFTKHLIPVAKKESKKKII
ncbi:hypothetical protein AAFR86_13955 [Salmonella enterica subsp. diarizonae serovar 58:r:z53]